MAFVEKSNEQITTESHKKLARMYHYEHTRYRNPIFKDVSGMEGNINYQVPNSASIKLRKPDAIGNTAMHFAAKRCDSEAAKVLIDRGADPTVINKQGLTAVHLFVRSIYNDRLKHYLGRDYFMTQGKVEEPFVNLLLAAQIQQHNTTNPRDPHGVSHLHAACMANYTEAVEFFLNNQVDVNEAIDVNSSLFAGCTPLHVAARLGCPEVAYLLVNSGANLLHKDSEGRTPLHLVIQRNMTIVQYMNLQRHNTTSTYQSLQLTKEQLLEKIECGERIIASILSKADKVTMQNLDLSPFYLMYRLKNNTSTVKNFSDTNFNESITVDSVFWAGYSALHFAARFNDVNTFKLLLENGADIEAKDANGETPLDMCLGMYDVEDISSIICSNVKWREIVLTDGKTKLVDLVHAMRNAEQLASFIDALQLNINDISIAANSPLWPSATMLHLAVLLAKKCDCLIMPWYAHEDSCFADEIIADELIKVCVRYGAEVTAQDARGSTPLHLAFRRYDADNVLFLLEHHESNSNPVDRDNVSHLHIACACAMGRKDLVKRLINAAVNINDAVLASFRWDWKLQVTNKINSEEYFIIGAGSTALHVAMAENFHSTTIIKMLMEAGADLDARDHNGMTPIHLLLTPYHCCRADNILEILSSPLIRHDCVVNGLSYLHLAIFAADSNYFKFAENFEKLLNLGADVNSAIKTLYSSASQTKQYYSFEEKMALSTTSLPFLFNFYDGYTPLQLLLDKVMRFDEKLARVLMDQGADVFAKNSLSQSPIHTILKKPLWLAVYMDTMTDEDEKRLFDEMGVTKLHLACLLWESHEEMVQDCLKEGINVNAQIRPDSKIWPGSTPLHLLIQAYNYYCYCMNSQYNHFFCMKRHEAICIETRICYKKIIRLTRLLLASGADVTIADANGDTPLLLKIEETYTDTQMTPPYVKILMNSCKKISVNPVNARGISHFHLACMMNDVGLMEKFLKLGVDVNQTVDYFSDLYPGYTPLHFAVMNRNFTLRNEISPLRSVNLLLRYGANVHARDLNDVTPLHVVSDMPCFFNLTYKRMIRMGANPEAKDGYDKTPADEFENHNKRWMFVMCQMFSYCFNYPRYVR